MSQVSAHGRLNISRFWPAWTLTQDIISIETATLICKVWYIYTCVQLSTYNGEVPLYQALGTVESVYVHTYKMHHKLTIILCSTYM